jgi:hypothetical protein
MFPYTDELMVDAYEIACVLFFQFHKQTTRYDSGVWSGIAEKKLPLLGRHVYYWVPGSHDMMK